MLTSNATLSLREKRHRLAPSIEALTGERNKIKDVIHEDARVSKKKSRRAPSCMVLGGFSIGECQKYANLWTIGERMGAWRNWYTRTLQERMEKSLGVRVSPRPLDFFNQLC